MAAMQTNDSPLSPSEIYLNILRKHSDIRMACHTTTVANLAHLVSERKVDRGARTTLLAQCQRIKVLARNRCNDFVGMIDEIEQKSFGSVK